MNPWKSHRGRAAILGVLATSVIGMAPTAIGAAVADTDPMSAVESLSAIVDAEAVHVSGRATFADSPVTIARDEAGDGSPTPLGDDLTTGTISRPNPFGDELTFTLGVANPPPTLDGIPEAITYHWYFAITHPNGVHKIFELQARRTSQSNAPDTERFFGLYQCAPAAVGDTGYCNLRAELTGTMEDGNVEWHVPLEALNDAEVGSIITDSQVAVIPSLSGFNWIYAPLDELPAQTTPYTIPGPSIRVGIAPAGTAPSDVPLIVSGTLAADGTFTGEVPIPDTPGEYVVAAAACVGELCGSKSTGIVLPP